jgi:hypothetical protein
VIRVVGAFGMLFFLGTDEAAAGLDFSILIEGSLAVTQRAVCELDVLVQCGFGLSHKNLLAG